MLVGVLSIRCTCLLKHGCSCLVVFLVSCRMRLIPIMDNLVVLIHCPHPKAAHMRVAAVLVCADQDWLLA